MFAMNYGILRNRANFNEKPNMRVCEHERASTRLNFATKSSKGQILREVQNFF